MHAQGINKSWALVTYQHAHSVERALAATVAHGSVVLAVKPVSIEAELAKPTTGALAKIWRVQQQKEAQWMRGLLQGMQCDPGYQVRAASSAR